MKSLSYVQCTTLDTCQAQLKHCNILPWIFIFYFPPLLSPLADPNQNSGKQGFISCNQNCVAVRGNLTLATTFRDHVGRGIEGHGHLFADKRRRED